MTNTTIISGVSAGTSTNVGSYFNPVKTTLQAATTAVKINACVTFGALGGANASSVIRVRQAVSQVSYSTATVGALALTQGSSYVDLQNNGGSTDIEKGSDVLVTGSGYHYCWVEMPTLTTACTLNVYLQELP